MKTIPEMLATVVRENADRVAVVEGETAATYAALDEKVASLASQLQAGGVSPGDRVGLMLHNSLDFVTGYFAIAALGGIVVPLNDHYQQTELLYFLGACGVSAVVTSSDFEALIRRVISAYDSPCHALVVGEKGGEESGAPRTLGDFAVEIDPDTPAMYQFSSGSTGTPKCIGRTHRQVLFELGNLVETLGLTHDDRFIGVAPFSHVNGLMRSMMASVRSGAALYPLPRFERQAAARVIEENKITVFIAVPFMFSMLAKSNFRPPPDFSSLRLCVSASAPMPLKMNQEFHRKFGLHVRQLYGSTETGTISVNLSPDAANSLESVGTPILGVEVEVFREDGSRADTDEMGELAVKSPSVIEGYLNLDDVNREVFRDGYFFTGDLGRRDGRQLLYLMGRKKFFINKGGFKIDPREIEEIIESHPGVEEVVVVGVPTTYGDEKVKAVVVRRGECSEEELVEHCRGKIADFKVPSLVEFREALPKSPTGKIRRMMLIDPEGDG